MTSRYPFETVLILGGTSDIGRATAVAFARKGCAIQLAGRDIEALRREADDIATRSGKSITVHRFDVLDTASFESFVNDLPELPDIVVSMVGLLGEQKIAQRDSDHAIEIMRSNYEGPALILGLLANRFLDRGSGMIIGVSSVAGDRGRGSNYAYGSAKAGFTAYLSGLRNRLAKQGVHVLTVKPGFVRTRMTRDMNLPKALTMSPEAVAAKIVTSAEKRRDVVYSNLRWAVIMAIVEAIPETIFKKLNL